MGLHSPAAELPADPSAAVRALIQAYNERDHAEYASMLAEDVRWYSINGNEISVEGEGAAAIAAWTRSYLEESCTTCRSELLSVARSGRFVATIERASWTGADGSCLTQTSPAVYEVIDGRVRAVWYYPASNRTECGDRGDP